MNIAILSNRLIQKLTLSFLAILILAGLAYTAATIYFSNKYYHETTQRLHANLAQDLIDEKFVDASPIDDNGAINKELFGDIMHNMMAVNRAIEVYLLDMNGLVQHSIAVNQNTSQTYDKHISLAPIKKFIDSKGQEYVLGDDPKNNGEQKVFSAAKYHKGNKEGYVYIILAGEEYLSTRANLFKSYALKLGLGSSILTLLFTGLLGVLSVWYLTKNLRELVYAAKRFQQGDLEYRIENADQSDLAGVTTTYNEMAETILEDIDKIKSVDKLRRELIANISHDLRTPLAIMQGYVETLQMKEEYLSREERINYLNTVNSSGERLSKLIQQLFEYSKLEANQIEPEKEPFLISELAHDIHTNYKVIALQKNVSLNVEIEESIPLVFADISLVERAICLLYTSPSPRDKRQSRMPSSA